MTDLYRDESTPDRQDIWRTVDHAVARAAIGESRTRTYRVLLCSLCGREIDESGGCDYSCAADYTPVWKRKPELTTQQRWVRTDKLVDQGPFMGDR